MDVSMIARVLWLRRGLRGHERWSRAQLEAHQRREAATLRAFAAERSPFYRDFHRGLDRAPLGELPVITKATVMDNFDQISTDPAVRLADLQAYLDALHGNQPFLGRYWVAATSGSSGRKSIIPASVREWAMIIASYGRANEWAGIRSGPAHRISMAVVSSTTAWHQSSRVAATVRSTFIASERLDAASPLPAIAARLNDLQPDVLVAYASMIRALAAWRRCCSASSAVRKLAICHSTMRRHISQVGHGASSHRAAGIGSRGPPAGLLMRRSRTVRPASTMASSISGAATCNPADTKSGQPAAAFAATVPTVRTRANCRSQPIGWPIQVSTRSSTTTPISPPSMPTGTSGASGTPLRLARPDNV